MNRKVVLLFSGGLDSLLSYFLLKNAGFEVKVVQFYMPFLHIIDREKHIQKIKENYGIDLNLIDISEKYLEILLSPKYGYGDNLNPCVDCKILFLKEAKRIMEKEGYDCVATGEIPGQRPFSQQRSFMNLIEKEAGVRGYILRPLSISTSKVNFEFDNTKFYDLKGRSRKVQLALAKKFNINPVPSPAGGCLLTDAGYCLKIEKLREIFSDKELKPYHFEIIKHGRVFTINEKFLIIVGRNRIENQILKNYSRKVPSKIFIQSDIPSPVILVLPDRDISEVRENILEIFKKYTKKEFHEKIKIF